MYLVREVGFRREGQNENGEKKPAKLFFLFF